MKLIVLILVLLAVLPSGMRAVDALLSARQYHYANETVNWREAQSLCRLLHSDLATVTTSEEAKRLVEVSHKSIGGLGGKTWIGLWDDLNSWTWSNPGDGDLSPSVYSNWVKDQPDNFNGNQLCVKMVGDGGWDDNCCNELLPFVCYNATAVQNLVGVLEGRNWLEAQHYCQKFHTDLVSIMNETYNEKVRNITNGQDVWIGLHRTQKWSDGSDSLFRLWEEKQPDNANGTQQCTAVDLGTAEGFWSDEDCTLKLPYVCLKDDVQVVNLQVKLQSTVKLTDKELAVLVSREFSATLIQMGLPDNFKIRLIASSTSTDAMPAK